MSRAKQDPALDVVISGAGVVSPLGTSRADLWARFARGERAAALPEERWIRVDDAAVQALLESTGARVGRLDRLCRLSLAAARLALADAALEAPLADSERVGLVVGTGLGCLLTNAEYNGRIVENGLTAASPQLFAYTVSSAAAGEISIALGIHGPNTTLHQGFAAGIGAIGYGFDLLRAGEADVVLALGSDVCGPALVDALDALELLKSATAARAFTDATPGLLPADGAAAVVLERADRAQARGGRALARVEGWAAGFEPTLTSTQPETTGIEATVRRAIATSQRTGADVGVILASAHGSPLDRVELGALRAALGPDASPLLFTPKDALGEAFAASGTLAAALGTGMLDRPALLEAPLARDLEGRALGAVDLAGRLEASPVVLVNALCYSGSIASLTLAPMSWT